MNVIAERLEKSDSITLLKGAHGSFEAGVCAMEAVAWLAGEKHSDHPECTDPLIAGLVRNWNDNLPDADRTRLIRPLLPTLIGTRTSGTPAQKDAVLLKRMWLVQDWYMRVRTPAFLRLAGLSSDADELAALPPIKDLASLTACTDVATKASRSASAACSAAYSAAESAACSAARSAARSAAYSAAESAAYSAAYSAACSAACSAAYSAAESAAESAAKAVFAPTVAEIQASYAEFIVTLCSVKE